MSSLQGHGRLLEVGLCSECKCSQELQDHTERLHCSAMRCYQTCNSFAGCVRPLAETRTCITVAAGLTRSLACTAEHHHLEALGMPHQDVACHSSTSTDKQTQPPQVAGRSNMHQPAARKEQIVLAMAHYHLDSKACSAACPAAALTEC